MKSSTIIPVLECRYILKTPAKTKQEIELTWKMREMKINNLCSAAAEA